MGQNEKKLNQRLQEFRTKFYTDKLIRGSLILTILFSSILFVALLSEGLFGFSADVRTGIVYTLGGIFVAVLGYMVVWPLTQLLNISRTISDFQIAGMVKERFPNINDKLINLLQLRTREDANASLVSAAIHQKSDDITPVKLSSAINLKMNYKYLRLLAIPLLMFLCVFIYDASFLSSSTYRLVNYDQTFTPPPPFSITLGELPDEIVAGQDLDLKVNVDGRELPGELFVFIKKESENQFIDYNLTRETATKFSYKLTDIKEDFALYIGNPEVKSTPYEIHVLKRPFIKNFKVMVNYPSYTGLGSETLEDNVGDFKVIKGTTVTWELQPQGDVKEAYFMGTGKTAFKKREEGNKYRVSKRLMGNFDYFISLVSNENIENVDTVKYHVDILNDRYPSIYLFSPNADFVVDVDPRLPLEMEVADDFGFTKMSLFYRFTKSGGVSAVSGDYQEYKLPIAKSTLLQAVAQEIDLTQLGLREGDEVEYYVKVWDNDAVSGPKSSTSGTFKIVYPTLGEKYEEAEEKQEELKADISETTENVEDLKEAYKKVQEKLLDKKRLSFDDREEIKELIKEHKEILEDIEDIQKDFEEQKERLEENQMISQETLEKFEELDEYLKELDNPEVEEMLRELQEKLDNLNPEDIRDKLENLQMNDEEMQQSLERTLELLKQLEVQQKIDELRNKLDNLAAKQDMLNEKLENAKKNEMDKLAQQQEELNDQFEDVKEELDKLQDMKSETSTPDKDKMDDLKQEASDTKQDMQDASEQMKGGEKKDASKSQKGASQKMKEMSKKLSSMQMQMQSQQDQQNLEHLRELLENLLKLSFDQEDLRDDVKKLKYGDPMLKDRGRDQKKLEDDMGLIRDSLESLANQVFQIKKFVLDESQKIRKNMKQTQKFFRNKQVPKVTYHQQLAMTSINNLANMLSDVMDQIQQQMKNSKPGNSMCQKPGSGSMQQLGKQQQQLNQMMQQMMGSGQVDPNKLAQMAAQQEAIRKQLKEMHDKVKKEGGKMLGDMGKVMGDMKDTENELMNKQLTHEMMERQQQILSRLLQADKSVRERDLDKKREGKTAKSYDKKAPEELTREEYKTKLRQEMLKSNKMEYSSDFIILIDKYYKKLEETND